MESQERGISPADTVAAVALRHPGVIPVFEQLGIDYCCGGGGHFRTRSPPGNSTGSP